MVVRSLLVAFIAALGWTITECGELTLSAALRFAQPSQLPLFLVTHLALGVTACLLLQLGSRLAGEMERALEAGHPHAFRLTRRIWLGLVVGFFVAVWCIGCWKGLFRPAQKVVAISLALLFFAAALWLLPRWRRNPSELSTNGLVARAVLSWAGMVALHLFNHWWVPKNYVPVHAAASVIALGAALAGAGFTAKALARVWRPARRLSFGTRGGWERSALAGAAVLLGAVVVTHQLWTTSNDVRHMIFTRAFDARGVLYVARRLPGNRPVPRTKRPLFRASAGRETAPSGRPLAENVLLISIDALRADHLPVYGYQRATAPAISAWASDASVFDWAWSVSGRTVTSLRTILGHPADAGLLGSLAVHKVTRSAVMTPRMVTHLGSKWLGSAFGSELHTAVGDAAIAERGIRVLEGMRHRFVWLHLQAPHHPYDGSPPNPFGERAIDRYDAEILRSDTAVGTVLSALDRLGLASRTAVIVTSDHGEEFREHGGTTHGSEVHNEIARIPLLVRIPGVAPRRISSHVTQADFGPTIAGLMGLRASHIAGSRSLLPMILGEEPEAQRLIHIGPLGTFQTGAVIDGHWKLVYSLFNRSFALFDMRSDPGETLNLYEAAPERARKLEKHLGSFIK